MPGLDIGSVVVRPLRVVADDIEQERKIAPYMARLIGMLVCRGETLDVILPKESEPIDRLIKEENWAELAPKLRELASTAEKRAPGSSGGNMAISPHAQMVLDQPMTTSVCYDFREIRSRVMYKAWQIMDEERVPFGTAVKRAWDWAKAECAKVGAIV